MSRVFVLILFYGRDHVASCLREVRRSFGRLIEPDNANVILVQNLVGAVTPGFLAGDNTDQEFSGWQTGWEALNQRGLDDLDTLLVVNDSFHRNYDASIWRDHYERLAGVDRVVGWRGQLPENVRFHGVPRLSYVRTNFFLVNVGALRRAGGFLPAERIERPLSDPRLDVEYRDYLGSWLTGVNLGATALGHFWYKAEALTPESEARLQAKARAIYHEHHLAFRLWTAGVSPIWVQDQPTFQRRWDHYRRWKRFLPVRKPGGSLWQG